ncbi:uncharacterized protein LOC130957425 isoform X2 [Arachis stenosperma]|uniref:uncharacterized protein LOC130957425 isoform X2 n=1 Tax=Arachis stenosperma TaxID=217475 RepID=UPI0025AD4C2B|nr:uncharacterized protein LOC130957425 isoform X2 [Arachis stenosperma]
MTSLSKLFNRLCGRIIILLAYLLLQLIILIKKLESSFTGPIAKLQYLRFIEEKNPTIPYTNEMKPRHVQCTVCLSEFKEEEKVRSLKCQHVFHRDCLDTWLQEYRATCPLCRVKLLPDDVVSKRRVLRSQLGSDVNGVEPPSQPRLSAPSSATFGSLSPSSAPHHSIVSPLSSLLRSHRHSQSLTVTASRRRSLSLSPCLLTSSLSRSVLLPCVLFVGDRKLTEDRNQEASLHLLLRASQMAVVVFLVAVWKSVN